MRMLRRAWDFSLSTFDSFGCDHPLIAALITTVTIFSVITLPLIIFDVRLDPKKDRLDRIEKRIDAIERHQAVTKGVTTADDDSIANSR